MDVRGLLTEGFGRVAELYPAIVDGLDEEALHHRPGGTGNPIAWLLWHTARMQDSQVADLTGEPQVWMDWLERFGLDNGIDDIGYGHTSEQVDAIRIRDVELLTAYHHEVNLETARYLSGVDEQELAREIDQSWDPPVTVGQRLISIQADGLQHLGQAAYVKGLL